MPSLRIHCAISKKRTGKTYEELHRWIDEKKGINHRNHNHFFTLKLRNYVFENFGGKEAISEWLFHIALDNLDTYMNNEWNHIGNKFNQIKFGFEENGFIHCDEFLVDDFEE